MRIDQVMSTPARSIAPDVDAAVAFEQMSKSCIRHLVVVANEHVVGVLSQGDLGGRSGALRLGKQVSELMSSKVIVVSPETSVEKAAQLLRGMSIGCVPVVDGKELVGIVTTADLLSLLVHRDAIKPHRKRSHVARRMDT